MPKTRTAAPKIAVQTTISPELEAQMRAAATASGDNWHEFLRLCLRLGFSDLMERQNKILVNENLRHKKSPPAVTEGHHNQREE